MADATPILPAIEPASAPSTPVTPGAAVDGVFAALLAQRLTSSPPVAAGPPGTATLAASPLQALPADDSGLPLGGNPLPLRNGSLLVQGLASSQDLSPALPTADDGTAPSLDPLESATLAEPSAAAVITTLAGETTGTPAPATELPAGPALAGASVVGPIAAFSASAAASTPAAAPAAVEVAPATDRPRELPAAVLRMAQAMATGGTDADHARAPSLGIVPGNAATAASPVAPPLVDQALDAVLRPAALARPFHVQIERLLAKNIERSAVSAPLADTAADGTTAFSPPSPALTTAAPAEPRHLGHAAVPTLGLAQGVTHPGWSNELSQRLVWLAQQEIREAKLQLNPRHLGPIDVRIVYGEGQQLSVSFNAHHPAAREALDAALPRLREMFDQQGLNLGDASVSQESFAQGQQAMADDAGRQAFRGRHATGVEGTLESPPVPPAAILGSGLLDAFA